MEPDADRTGVPRSLVAFAAAALLGVLGVVVIVWTESAWGVVFAVALELCVFALVLGQLPVRFASRRSRVVAGDAPPPAVPAAWSGPPARHRLLLVASEPLDGRRIERLLDGGRDSTAVLVVAPALHRSALRYWVSDSDEAIEHARRVQAETLRSLQREQVPSGGHVGSADPVTAIEDALEFFDADRIALALHTRGRRRYRERDLRAEVERRFRRPVVVVEPQPR